MRLSDRPPWIIRTYAGFADAQATNQRYRANLKKGQRGLSVAFDLPTQNGYDADHPMAAGEVGGTGVAVSSLDDMRRLFEEIDPGAINTSMTINATAAWHYALYLALAGERGAALGGLRGTTQNDLMKEFVARGTYVFDPASSLRLQADLITYAAEHTPRWNPTNCCGYHFMESGATPAQELGFALGNAMLVLDAIRGRISEDAFALVVRRISYFVNSGIELVDEISKMRAYQQLWKQVCKAEFGVDDVQFRAGCQVRSLTLTAQQPEVNIVRIAYQALPVVLSASARVGALQLPGFREALGLPDEAEQTLALRTQQVLMYETGLSDHPDIFEGSKVIEKRTAEIAEEALNIAQKMRQMGYTASIGWVSRELSAALVRWQARVESGEQVVVGLNAFEEPVGLAGTSEAREAAADPEALGRHLDRLAEHKRSRDGGAVDAALDGLRAAFESGENIVPASLTLARAGGTTGEWTAVLEEAAGGRYAPPLGAEGAESVPLQVPTATTPVRLVLGKSGLDGHVNAVKLMAVACARAGIEVVYTGIKQPPEAIVAAALQEDADVIGISSLSGAHLHIAQEVSRLLAERGGSDIPVVMGGIIPDKDHAALQALGVRAVFTPGSQPVGEMIARIIELAGSG